MNINQKEECCICMENQPNTLFSPCKHSSCLGCSIKISDCPLCRSPIKSRISKIEGENDTLVGELCVVYPSSEPLFQSILQIIKGNDPQKVASLMLQLAEHIGGYLSVAQSETILIKAKDEGLLHYVVQNNVVKLCNQPWLINTKLGGSGICYHGNFGETPFLQNAINILKYNFKTRRAINAF